MTLDRAELAGTGVAVAFHVALIAALSMSLAQVSDVPEPPSMEVELVDEVALTASAPTSIATPPPAAQAPEIAPIPDPVPQPMPDPVKPAPRIEPRPAPRAIAPAKAQPQRPTPQRPQPRPRPRASQLGDDFLKGIPNSPSKSTAPAKAAAAKYDAKAKAQIGSLILAQIKPCADRQRRIGNGAERMVVVLNLRLFLNGGLKGAPRVVRIDGKDTENEQYADLATDQAIATYRECSPLRLPAELYATSQGGWSNIDLKYRVR